jgi:PIN like domain
MADLIYIDANKYLEFYKANDQAIVATLTALEQHAKRVFVTRRIVDEVKRNKLQYALRHMGEYRDQYKVIQLDPEPWYLHKVRTKAGGDRVKKHSTLITELDEKITRYAREVSRSEDVISKHLRPYAITGRTVVARSWADRMSACCRSAW